MSKSPAKRKGKEAFNDSGLDLSIENDSSCDEDERQNEDNASAWSSGDDSDYRPSDSDNEFGPADTDIESEEEDMPASYGNEGASVGNAESNVLKSEYKSKDKTVWTTKAQSPRRKPPENIPRFDDPGPLGLASNRGLSPTELFRLFIGREMLEEIVKCTNEYALTQTEQHRDKKNIWSPVDVIEMEAFIGLLLLAGVEKSKRQDVQELWSSDLRIGRPAFTAAMGRNRFMMIMGSLRFRSRSARETQAQRRHSQTQSNHSKIGPIEDLFAMLNLNFGKYYRPGVYLTVDEMLVRFFGRACFRVYMKSKPGKYGIKIWVVVDAETGYILKIQIYQGKTDNATEKEQGRRVVLDLTEPYLDCGRGITADNFFTSKDLALELLRRKTTYVGTIRKNRMEVPSELVDPRGREDLSSIFVFNDKLTLVSYVPKKGRTVLLLSSEHHSPKTETTGKKKPEIILHYNSTKAGVDTVDQMVNTYSCQRQSSRWPMKVFYALLDMAALNTFVIWKHHHHHKSETAKTLTRRTFIREICFELLKANISRRASKPSVKYPIRTAMLIMGVDRPRLPKPPEDPSGMKYIQVSRCSRCGTSSRSSCDNCYRFACKRHKRVTVTNVCLDCLDFLKQPKVKPSNLDLDEDCDSEGGGVSPSQPSNPASIFRAIESNPQRKGSKLASSLTSIRSKPQGIGDIVPGRPHSPLMPVLEPEEHYCQEIIGRKEECISSPIQLLLPSAASTPIPIRISEPNMPTFGYSIVFDLAEVQNATGEVLASGQPGPIALPSTIQNLPPAPIETEGDGDTSILWESASLSTGRRCSDIRGEQLELHREQGVSMEQLDVDVRNSTSRKRPSADVQVQTETEIAAVQAPDFYSKLFNAPENEFNMFCLSMAPKLQRISVMDRLKAADLQMKIHALLMNTELELGKSD